MSPRGSLAARAAVLVVAAAAFSVFRVRTGIVLEDALITFRYAANIATGRGFVYNPDERVLGTTTPLQTLLLALPALLGADVRPSAAVLGLLCGVLAVAATDVALRAAGVAAGVAVLGALAWALHPDAAWSAAGGMETPLVVLLMALSLAALLQGRDRLALLACALLVMARLDGVLWAGLVGLFALRRGGLRPALPGAAVLVVWTAFAFAYFGSPVPHSILAKRVIGLPPASFHEYASWYANGLVGLPGRGLHVLLARGAWLVLALLGLSDGGVDRRARFIPAAWLALLFAFYVAGRAPLLFEWYLVPVTWASLLLAAIGLARLWRRTPERGAFPWRRGAVVILGLAVIVAETVQWPRVLAHHRDYQANESALRRRVGEWLRTHTPETATVAMEAIGYQGYYSTRRVIDLAGLVSPEVVRIRRESRTNAAAFARILEELHPDYLVLRSFEADSNEHFHGGLLFESPGTQARFRACYEEAVRMAAPRRGWGRVGELTVYARRPCPSS